MSDVRRTVSAAPPPRRSIEVPEPTEEGSHKLNLDGFSLPVTAPAVGDRGPRAVPEGRRVSATGMTKTTIQLPNRLVGRLRAWKAETGRSNADAVLTAYINQLEAVRTRHAPTDEDKRRAEFGLPPLASTSPQADTAEERRVQVGLYVRAAAVDEVDATATELGLSRSQLVTELLHAELG